MRKVVFILLTVLLSATYVAKADNYYTKHWTPITGTQYNMTCYGYITIDGEEQFNPNLEVGAFCGNECRGSSIVALFPVTGQYIATLTIVSNVVSGETITFRLYDHDAGEELTALTCASTVPFVDNSNAGSVGNFFNFRFLNEVQINATVNPVGAGIVSGTGSYTIGDEVTLTADANYGYIFTNWIENDVEVSTNRIYSFTAETSRNLVANFRAITLHWIPIVGTQYNMTVYGIVLINGIEQTSPYLEVGAFCGDECRGSALAQYFPLTGQYVVPLTIVSNVESGEIINFYLYDHLTEEELTQYHDTNPITFENDAVIGTVGNWYPFSFSDRFNVTVIIEPAGAGTVDGTGEYFWGETAVLTANDNTGFFFKEWEKDGVIVSTERTYAFEVYSDVQLIARYYYMQTNEFVEGWNWWSTYIEMNETDGLTMLENGLGHNGKIIKSQYESVINFYGEPGCDDNLWIGSLTSIVNENSYLIGVEPDCNVAMVGNLADPADHPITLVPNWTWIGYPVTIAQYLEAAMGNFEPTDGDVIKGQSQSSMYFAGFGWFPDSFILTPGHGYKYQSHANENKSLVMVNSGNPVRNMTENRYWKNNEHAYAENMTVLLMVYISDEAQYNDNLEVGAFVDGESRGSARLTYFPPLDRYYAMLTVSGKSGEKVELALVDAQHNQMSKECNDNITFTSDAVLGSFEKPFAAHFGVMKDIDQQGVMIYPNPVMRGETFTVVVPDGEIMTSMSVINVAGAEVEGILKAGVYVVKVTCETGSVYYGKLIVK